MIRSYRVDKAIFSCKTIDREWGIMESQEAFAHAKRTMMACARKNILLVANTKFDQTAFSVSGDIAHVDTVVTDVCPSPEWRGFFAERGIVCLYPEAAFGGVVDADI